MSTTTTKNMETAKDQIAQPQKIPSAPVEKQMGLPENQLVSFGERITYTFAYGRDVGSVHFDRGRGEIFYKGHNVRNMDLEEWQMQVLEGLRKILATQEQGHRFAESYGKTLDKIVLEKKNSLK